MCGCPVSLYGYQYATVSDKLIVSRYVAESITTDAGHFGHVGLCQLCTKLKILQCELSHTAVSLVYFNFY